MASDRRQFFNHLVNVGALTGLAAMFPSDALAVVEGSIRGESPATGLAPQAGGAIRTHTYHAHAQIFGPDSHQTIGGQASIRLPEEGGFRSQFVEGYRSGNGVSFQSAYMQVAGNQSAKVGYGWVTLATAIVTGLNLYDKITADLVFAQVSTEHPLEGYVPSVTFLGTRFENLRIDGRLIEPEFDLGLCGPKPAGDKPYLQDSGFLARVSQQKDRINSLPRLPDWARQQDLGSDYNGSAALAQSGTVECSLVNSVEGAAPGTSFGHLIDVPGFGRVSLASLSVGRAFHLSMVHLESQAPGVQPQTVPSTGSNGHTYP